MKVASGGHVFGHLMWCFLVPADRGGKGAMSNAPWLQALVAFE